MDFTALQQQEKQLDKTRNWAFVFLVKSFDFMKFHFAKKLMNTVKRKSIALSQRIFEKRKKKRKTCQNQNE